MENSIPVLGFHCYRKNDKRYDSAVLSGVDNLFLSQNLCRTIVQPPGINQAPGKLYSWNLYHIRWNPKRLKRYNMNLAPIWTHEDNSC